MWEMKILVILTIQTFYQAVLDAVLGRWLEGACLVGEACDGDEIVEALDELCDAVDALGFVHLGVSSREVLYLSDDEHVDVHLDSWLS